MPIKLQKLEDEPILVSTMSGYITTDDIKVLYSESAVLLDKSAELHYRITDTREAESSFDQMIKALTALQNEPGAGTDKRIAQVVFVGTNTWVKLVTQFFQKMDNMNVTIFTDIESAFAYVRGQIKPVRQA